VQTLFTQVCAPEQTVPQALQLLVCAAMLVQAAPQRMVPVGHPPHVDASQA
jgi:hypothetical protein